MTDKEALMLAYGALKAIASKGNCPPRIINILEAYIFGAQSCAASPEKKEGS